MPPTKSGPAKPPVVQTKKRKPADGSSKKKKGSAWTKFRADAMNKFKEDGSSLSLAEKTENIGARWKVSNLNPKSLKA